MEEYDDEENMELNKYTKDKLRRRMADIKQGKVISTKELMRRLKNERTGKEME